MLILAERKICPANKSKTANYFLLNTAEYENFTANKYLLAEKISCSAEFSRIKV